MLPHEAKSLSHLCQMEEYKLSDFYSCSKYVLGINLYFNIRFFKLIFGIFLMKTIIIFGRHIFFKVIQA